MISLPFHSGNMKSICGRNFAMIALIMVLTGAPAFSADPFEGVGAVNLSRPGTATSSFSVVAADFDGNGADDIASAEFSDDVYVYFSNGSFNPFSTAPVPLGMTDVTNIAAGDIDNNGHIDLIGRTNFEPTKYILNLGPPDYLQGATIFQIQSNETSGTIPSVFLLDVNDDTYLDYITVDDEFFNIYYNSGSLPPFPPDLVPTTLSIPTTHFADSILSIDAGDVNGDNRTDIVVGCENGNGDPAGSNFNYYFSNTGATDPFDGADRVRISDDNHRTKSIALVDLNQNGKLDVVAGNYNANSRYYLNNESPMPFIGVPGVEIDDGNQESRDVLVADFGGDNILDLVLSGTPSVLLQGTGQVPPFTSATSVGTAERPYGLAFGRFDGNDSLDVVEANVQSPNRYFLNAILFADGFESGNASAWQ